MDVTEHHWLSLLPSLIAIGAAFATRQVFFSLFMGIWVGAFLLEGGDLLAIGSGLLRVADTWLIRAVAPADGSTEHMSVVMFTLMVGGTIGIISANGGMHGIVHRLTRFAHNRTRGQLSAYILGFIIFFDDYANTLIVGKTLRPLTDRLGISREKLAFIVDSTAAPVATIALVTTWIGFQLSLIKESSSNLDIPLPDAYEIFLNSLGYSFYPILMLVFILMIILMKRDFGPMYEAEARAAKQPYSDDKAVTLDSSQKAANAVVPILTLIFVTIGGLIFTGEGDTLRAILGSADPFKAILWGSLASVIAAVIMTRLFTDMRPAYIVEAMEDGFKPMLAAVMILTFAWAIAGVNAELKTADYIVSAISDVTDPSLLPALAFIIAAVTAFATGSSWGTMGILIPLIIPLSATLSLDSGSLEVVFASVACIMSGAVWGDHCSPISDTTILSSMASDCRHIDHVRTQMPYALTVAFISLVVCIIPTGFGLPNWIAFLAGGGILYFILKKGGKTVT
ncbi:MAG: sodium:proton antiporter [Rickettsiales bacterium]|nr:sodium:proton antiporter [Rickettsiales bacterium]